MGNKKEQFLSLCESIQREGIRELLDWLEHSDFYTAPASTRFHGNYEGGLLEHSLNVYTELKRLMAVYPEIKADEESLIIIALFHDLCKVNFYEPEQRFRKDEAGNWEKYWTFKINEKFCFGGHGSKSVFIVQSFIKLKPVEAVAINCHMSAWDGNKDVSNAFERYPLAWLLHVADESATYVLEGRKGE